MNAEDWALFDRRWAERHALIADRYRFEAALVEILRDTKGAKAMRAIAREALGRFVSAYPDLDRMEGP